MGASIRPAWRLLPLALCLTLGACASSPTPPMAIAQPLVDFNIMREQMPAPLKALNGQPYQRAAAPDCAVIAAEILQLDGVLGPDVDVPVSRAEARAAWRREMAGNLLRSLSTSWMTGRGVIRNVSGAEGRERRMKEAILDGGLRRAYLKGVSDQLGCAVATGPVLPGLSATVITLQSGD